MEPHQLTEAALSLPEPQRVELAAPDAEASAAWADEINRRLKSIDEGAVDLLPSEDVLAEMKRRRDG